MNEIIKKNKELREFVDIEMTKLNHGLSSKIHDLAICTGADIAVSLFSDTPGFKDGHFKEYEVHTIYPLYGIVQDRLV
jgi:hypothetical protein